MTADYVKSRWMKARDMKLLCPISTQKPHIDEVTAIILAGGVGRRLGYRNKALLRIGDKDIIERIIDALSEVTQHILLITNSPEEFVHLGLSMSKDILPDSGPLGGIYTGLKLSGTYHNLIVACDMPFIQPHVLKRLIEQRNGYDVIVPVTTDGYHPTCCVYSRDCMEPMEAQVKTGNLRVDAFFSKMKVKEVEFSSLYVNHKTDVFFNVNTHEDYLKAISMAAEAVRF